LARPGVSKRGASGVNGSPVLFGDLAYRLEVNAVSNELFSTLSGGSAVPDRRPNDAAADGWRDERIAA
jgi:hypothetical protein